ncbi:TRAP transporter substrate-binding protein [Cognatishimia sp. SS12]|uniref:TRAP transporter substrate-binding protein n=1 Tax=Cognatishimia sp. SS12 TaxID=2979465 RepID=UPI002330BCF2|nr:TRAP transporter substrate-binding protein [Cognatishimia sp. SS12]MDC0739558.1 TRAP transporter substrate-binding protein [Cognatishimia sp. SS12]
MFTKYKTLGMRAATAALIVGLAQGAMAETKLRMANWLPPVHHIQETFGQWIAEVEKATNGEVSIELMKAPLAPPPGQYDLVKNGAVDIAYSTAAFTPNQFALLQGVEIPFLFESAEAASAGAWQWYTDNGFDDMEFKDTKLLAVFTTAPFLLHARKPMTSLADLDGMKVRAGGVGIEILKRLGAAPVFIPPAGTTEAMERGTVDATQFPWEALAGFRLTELSSHHLEFPQGLYGTVFWVAMNKRSWDKLSPEAQAAIEGMGLSGSKMIGARWDAVEASGRQGAVDQGNTITTLSDADLAKVKDVSSFVQTDWEKMADDKGLNGSALIEELKSQIAANAQ